MNERTSDRPRLSERAALAAMVILMSAGGCNFLVDTERQQCKTPEDCAELLGGSASSFTCEETLCRPRTDCTSNEQCTTKGRNVCAAGLCVACAVDTDCPSPTARCLANACDDPTWGCLLEPDNRPAPTSSTSSIKLKALNVIASAAVPGLVTTVCRPAVLELNCANPLPNATSVYDSSGLITVSGLPHGWPYRLKLDPPSGSGLIDGDYYTNRLPRGDETAGDLGILPLAAITAVPTPFPIDLAKGSITARIYDCTGKLASNIEATLSDPPADLITIYLDTTMIPRGDLTTTTAAGIATLINVKPNVAVTLLAKISATMKIDFQVVTRGGASTFVDLYPRMFSSQ